MTTTPQLEPQSPAGVYVETRPPVVRIVTGVLAAAMAILTMTNVIGADQAATLQETLLEVALLLFGAYETVSGSIRVARLKSSKSTGDKGAQDVVVTRRAA